MPCGIVNMHHSTVISSYNTIGHILHDGFNFLLFTGNLREGTLELVDI